MDGSVVTRWVCSRILSWKLPEYEVGSRHVFLDILASGNIKKLFRNKPSSQRGVPGAQCDSGITYAPALYKRWERAHDAWNVDMRNMMYLWISSEAVTHTPGFESQFEHWLCGLYMAPCFPIWDWCFSEALHRRCLSQDLSTVHTEFSVKCKWWRRSGYLPGAIHSSMPGLAHLIFAKAPWVMCSHQPGCTDVLTKAQGGEGCARDFTACAMRPSARHRAQALDR